MSRSMPESFTASSGVSVCQSQHATCRAAMRDQLKVSGGEVVFEANSGASTSFTIKHPAWNGASV